ncbi:MAG: TspO/MBR family protein [Patescibacteria group bacterium]
MNKAYTWYATLRKPWFAPPASVFGPVWTVLYVIIAVSYGYVAYQAISGKLPLVVLLPFLLNLLFNILYSPIQFGLRNLLLATVDIFLVLATLVVALIGAYGYLPWVSLANIPYLLWVCFATLLQCTITLMNRDKWRAEQQRKNS